MRGFANNHSCRVVFSFTLTRPSGTLSLKGEGTESVLAKEVL